MKNINELENYIRSLGLDTFGFIPSKSFEELRSFLQYRKINGLENEFEETDIEKRINPHMLMEKGKVIISIAFPYLYNNNFNNDTGFSKYTEGLDYHIVVRSYLDKIVDFLNEKGYEAKAFVDSNVLPERYIAYKAGLGFVGKNNMIITEKYGSFVFLGEIITDMDIEIKYKDKKFSDIEKYESCGSCNICLKECPTKAINHKRRNSNICLSYITQKKQIEDKWFKVLGGRIFGCDSCQKSCPYNTKVKLSNIEGFRPLEFSSNIQTKELIYINNKEFKETLKNTSASWRGKNLIQRNALIRFINFENNKDIDIDSMASPYVKDYAIRLLKIREL
ncbi:tRNA epoxyqueuosine(34) reductase QueG [Clostridium algidicarnis]|uniref:tRNA epoxyqueuosine(34) reductase QueG n=1 Tax=Clostridium algidicarnis TaxID=37659 RepID=UPI0016292EBD|nr:tRNA epoxyqueuosine(34) reductase QueG [Clostridium algidicarnis]MBB6696738.1 tRNA epoxyqueuosine(34) reductase QueG [Clostridium algidicarnis]